jgi:hypothetical protein
MRQSMKAALRHVGLVFPGALDRSLPVLALLVWLDAAYGTSCRRIGRRRRCR